MRLLAALVAFPFALLLAPDARADEVDEWRKELGEQVELRNTLAMTIGISMASTGLVVGSTAIAAGAREDAFGCDSCLAILRGNGRPSRLLACGSRTVA